MRKGLRGLLIMGAAAGVSFGASSMDASAAALANTAITVDYSNQQMTVKSATGKDGKIYVAPTTVTTKKVKDKVTKETTEVTTAKVGAATEYDLGSAFTATVDLSSFAVTKDQYLSVWGNGNTDPVLVKLPAVKTKLQAVVDAAACAVTINDITDKKNPVAVTGIEYCTTNGKWADYTKGTTDLTSYAQFGATLRFRIKATAAKTLNKTTITVGTDADGKAITAYVADGNFAGNELKAKIAKTAAGPKATIDYNARTIKIPFTAEYRLTATADILKAMGTFKASGADKGVAILNADDVLVTSKNVATSGDFDLRTAATAKNPASKITEYKFPAVGTITAQTSAGKAFTAVTQDVTDSKIKDADIKVTKVVINSKTMAATVTITNNTTDAYQVIVGDMQDATTVAKLALPTATDKVTGKVPAANATKGTPGVGTIKAKSGQYIFISKQGDAKSATWSTPYVFLGQVMNILD